MKRYRVKALSMTGKGKKIYDSGDIVTADDIPDGNAEGKVAEGFLEELVEGTPPPSNPGTDAPPADPSTDEPKTEDKSEVDTRQDDQPKGVKSLEQCTLKQLQADLKALNILFDANATKKELYQIWVDCQK